MRPLASMAGQLLPRLRSVRRPMGTVCARRSASAWPAAFFTNGLAALATQLSAPLQLLTQPAPSSPLLLLSAAVGAATFGNLANCMEAAEDTPTCALPPPTGAAGMRATCI